MTHTQSIQKTNTLLLTFDYELFLGKRSGTVENCMLKPTEKILSIFKEFKIRNTIFFVDTIYLVRLKANQDPRCKEDYHKIVKQLQDLHQSGQYIFPHLHPHWLDAVYLPEINQWSLANSSRYCFTNLSEEQKEQVFSSSIAILEEITGKQPELGYRAGGWCIQPFTDFKPYFTKYNIRYDFSVLKGYSSSSDDVYFNFDKAPDKVSYPFNSDVCVEEKNGEFTEIPISQIKLGKLKDFLNEIWTKILYKIGKKNYGDGLSHPFTTLRNTMGEQMVSLELLTIFNVRNIRKEFKKTGFIHFISHPKMINPHHIRCLRIFLNKISDMEVNTDFKKINR